MQTLRVHILGVGKCAPSIMAVGTSSNGTEKPSLHALFVMHFTIQFEFGNEQGWMMRATRAAFYTRFPAKVLCVMLHKRGISPRLSLVLLQHTRHGYFYYCSRGKVVNDGGKAYMLKSTSPRATGTQSLCRVKISLPLPNHLKMFYCFTI